MNNLDMVKALLETKLPGAQVEVADMTGTLDHLEISIQAPQFQGKKTFQQHKIVMDLLKEALAGPVHAVKLNTKATN